MSLLLSLLLLVTLEPALHGTVDVMDKNAPTEPPPIIPLPLVTCNPNPDCKGYTEDKPLVDDPKDCHKFYLCISATDEYPMGPLDCDDGLYFDTTVKDCQPNGAEECKPLCPGGGGGGGKCSYSCPSPPAIGDLKADLYDCSYYYHCIDEITPISCKEPTPFFNGVVCQQDKSQCCHCTPFCNTGDKNKKVIDPLDCTRYYICVTENTVPEYSGTCPSGNFDPVNQECSMTVPCITMCTNMPNDKGCIDVYTCHEVGYFSACPNLCGPKYYHCRVDDVGNIIAATTCTDGNVFYQDNTQCVPPTDCPYPPPGF